MLTMTAAFTLALATSVSTTAVGAEEAPAGMVPTHATSGSMVFARNAFATNHRGREPTQTNAKPAARHTHAQPDAGDLLAGLLGSIVRPDGNSTEPGARSANNAAHGGRGRHPIGEPQESDDVGGIYDYPEVLGVADGRNATHDGEVNAAHRRGKSSFAALRHVDHSGCSGGMPSRANDGREQRMDDFVDRRIGVTEDSVGITFGAFLTATKAEKSAATPTDQFPAWGHHYGKSVGEDAPFLTAKKAF